MLLRAILGTCIAVTGTACIGGGGGGSSGGGGAGSCNITGTYAVTDIREPGNPGDCPPGETATPVQFFDLDDGTVEVVFPGALGSCTGIRNGCSVTFPCVVYDSSGNTIATFNAEYMFSQTGFTGYSTQVVGPGVSAEAPQGCTAHFEDTGVAPRTNDAAERREGGVSERAVGAGCYRAATTHAPHLPLGAMTTAARSPAPPRRAHRGACSAHRLFSSGLWSVQGHTRQPQLSGQRPRR